jgi:hypothetical protein
MIKIKDSDLHATLSFLLASFKRELTVTSNDISLINHYYQRYDFNLEGIRYLFISSDSNSDDLVRRFRIEIQQLYKDFLVDNLISIQDLEEPFAVAPPPVLANPMEEKQGQGAIL